MQSKEEARQQYAERQAEKYERLAKYSLDGENKRKYAARKEQWEIQAYKPILRGESSVVEMNPNKKIKVTKVTSYAENVYISDDTSIKPRTLHSIVKNTEEALERLNIASQPKIMIVSPDELPTAYGKYDAMGNIVYYIPQIADKEIIDNVGKIEFHEMCHAKQAEKFRKKYGEITSENYWEYINYSCEKAKKVIDAAGINEYNVNELSDYAIRMYRQGRYDEVEAEYLADSLRRK